MFFLPATFMPLAELSFAAAVSAAQVMAWRLPMLALGAVDPTPLRQREALRMVTEKQAAAVMGFLHLQTAVVSLAWSSWRHLSTPLVPSASLLQLAEAALQPAYRTANDNRRRLSARKRM